MPQARVHHDASINALFGLLLLVGECSCQQGLRALRRLHTRSLSPSPTRRDDRCVSRTPDCRRSKSGRRLEHWRYLDWSCIQGCRHRLHTARSCGRARTWCCGDGYCQSARPPPDSLALALSLSLPLSLSLSLPSPLAFLSRSLSFYRRRGTENLKYSNFFLGASTLRIWGAFT